MTQLTEPPAQPAVSLVVQSAVALLATKLALKTIGFPRTLRLIDRRVPAVRPFDAARQRALSHAFAAAVPIAAAFLPGRMRCLEQSLALQYLLRRQGVESTFVLGVTPFRFEAHAWVECAGEPLNESGELIRKLLPMRINAEEH